ncbi:MAG: hypothetical protein K2O32_15540 [Acetatifactor sp.]|nr:hypothetical protein [Acetatifactor sp.]
MKKFRVLLFGAVICLFLSGCGKKENRAIEQKIVFICCYVGYAEGYHNSGYCIDNQGYKVEYDLTPKHITYQGMDRMELYEYLLEHLETLERQPFLSEEELRTCYNNLYEIDPEAKMESKLFAFDRSSYILYGVQLSETGEPILVTLREDGSYLMRNTDENAREIINLIGWNAWISGNRDDKAKDEWDGWNDTEGWKIWEW